MSLLSMTGFGKSVIHREHYRVIAEIRCLNGRGLDLSLRLSPRISDMEPELRAFLSERLIRGKADVVITFQSMGEPENAGVNETLLRNYIQKLRQITLTEDIPHSDILNAALRLPDVMTGTEEVVTEDKKKDVLLCADEALNKLEIFREKEGAGMAASVALLLESIHGHLAGIAKLAEERKEGFRLKLLRALESGELKAALDNNRFEQELIYYLEKQDINEEMVRLEAHLSHFRRTMENESHCGRKLGFIAQEIGREINTLGSKAAHAEIQKYVTEMKDSLEKIKELLLNIL